MQLKNLNEFKHASQWPYGYLISESNTSPIKSATQLRSFKSSQDNRPAGELEQKRVAKKTLSIKPTNKVRTLIRIKNFLHPKKFRDRRSNKLNFSISLLKFSMHPNLTVFYRDSKVH